MLQKEPKHLARCIGTAGIGVALLFVAAGPCMAAAVNNPQLASRLASEAEIDGAREPALPSAGACSGLLRPMPGPRHCPCRGSMNRFSIGEMHHLVLIAMKHDARDGAAALDARDCGFRLAAGPFDIKRMADGTSCARPASTPNAHQVGVQSG